MQLDDGSMSWGKGSVGGERWTDAGQLGGGMD